MNAREAESEFERFLAARGLAVSRLSPGGGAQAMMEFYRLVRADGCDFDRDEDMLLFQWHAAGADEGFPFVYDISRQLIFEGSDDENIWQLSLRFEFEATEPLVALGSGDRWCPSLRELDAFELYVQNHPATLELGRRTDSQVILRYACAG